MGPWVHNIDPIIGTIFGVHLWWYGLGYSLGFLNAHVFFLRRRAELGLSRRDVYELSLLLSTGVLVGARLLVVNNEWAFYRDHLALIPAIWLGGMATHGLILGGFAGVVLFCVLRRRPLLVMAGRAGNPGGPDPVRRTHRQLHRRADRRQRHGACPGRSSSPTPRGFAIRSCSTTASRTSSSSRC